MREATSFVDILRERAALQPDTKAFTFAGGVEGDEQTLTYAMLDEQARALAARLQDHGLGGERVVLLYPPGAQYVVALLGCMYAGATAVPLYPPRDNASLDRILAVARSADAAVVLASEGGLATVRRIAPSLAENPMQWLSTSDDTGQGSSAAASAWKAHHPSADALAVLQFTSGSTDTPKGVMLRQGNLLANSAIIQRTMRTSADDRGVMWVPPYHDMGLIGGILQPLYTGFPVYLMSPAGFVQKPRRWLEAITRERATISGGPNFAYELCVDRIAADKLDGIDLSSWRVAINGAEPVRATTLNRFAAHFSRCGFGEHMFYPCYGLAEATLYVSGHDQGGAPGTMDVSAAALTANRVEIPGDDDDRRTLTSSGRPDRAVTVRIVDAETGRPLSDGAIGEIWVSGESVASGYWRNEQESARAFGAKIVGEAQTFSYLRTGDLGFLAGGELYVTGRLKDLIIIRGKNHYPQDIELTVSRSHPSLQPGAAAAFVIGDEDETLGIVVEVRRGFEAGIAEIETAINYAVTRAHGVVIGRLALIRPGSLAKTSSGKVRRFMCRMQMLNQTLKLVEDKQATTI